MKLPPVEHSWDIPADKADELPADFAKLQTRLQEATDAFQGDVPELLEEIERICDETHMEGLLSLREDSEGRVISAKTEFRSRWKVTHTMNFGIKEEA